jgi:hypothetical protein
MINSIDQDRAMLTRLNVGSLTIRSVGVVSEGPPAMRRESGGSRVMHGRPAPIAGKYHHCFLATSAA